MIQIYESDLSHPFCYKFYCDSYLTLFFDPCFKVDYIKKRISFQEIIYRWPQNLFNINQLKDKRYFILNNNQKFIYKLYPFLLRGIFVWVYAQ